MEGRENKTNAAHFKYHYRSLVYMRNYMYIHLHAKKFQGLIPYPDVSGITDSIWSIQSSGIIQLLHNPILPGKLVISEKDFFI
jgi:hypothetical protein